MRDLPEPVYLNRALERAKYKRFVQTPDGGFWAISQRPFDEVATDMLRSAMLALQASPIISNPHS